MNTPIPIAVFIFNRPQFAKNQAAFISRLSPRTIYLVSDGWRDPIEKDMVLEARQNFVNNAGGHKVVCLFSETNLGLVNRFYSALDFVSSREDRFCVIEDDCHVSQGFVDLCEVALNRFGRDARFGICCAHNPTPQRRETTLKIIASTFPRIWGWATTSQVWQSFRDSNQTTLGLKRLVPHRPLTAALMFWLLWRRRTAISSWDIYFVAYLIDQKLTSICANHNLVENMGLGVMATNAHTFGEAELPRESKWRDIEDFPARMPVRISLFRLLREDAIRVFRWVKIGVRNPLLVVSKLVELSKTV